MKYRQLNAEERRVMAALRKVGLSKAEIAQQQRQRQSSALRRRTSFCAAQSSGVDPMWSKSVG